MYRVVGLVALLGWCSWDSIALNGTSYIYRPSPYIKFECFLTPRSRASPVSPHSHRLETVEREQHSLHLAQQVQHRTLNQKMSGMAVMIQDNFRALRDRTNRPPNRLPSSSSASETWRTVTLTTGFSPMAWLPHSHLYDHRSLPHCPCTMFCESARVPLVRRTCLELLYSVVSCVSRFVTVSYLFHQPTTAEIFSSTRCSLALCFARTLSTHHQNQLQVIVKIRGSDVLSPALHEPTRCETSM